MTPSTSGIATLMTTTTPKIDKLLGLKHGITECVVSYFGPIHFLDDQPSFTSVFGIKPQVLGSNPSRLDVDKTREEMQDYANKFMFDVFLYIFLEYYVDIDDGIS